MDPNQVFHVNNQPQIPFQFAPFQIQNNNVQFVPFPQFQMQNVITPMPVQFAPMQNTVLNNQFQQLPVQFSPQFQMQNTIPQMLPILNCQPLLPFQIPFPSINPQMNNVIPTQVNYITPEAVMTPTVTHHQMNNVMPTQVNYNTPEPVMTPTVTSPLDTAITDPPLQMFYTQRSSGVVFQGYRFRKKYTRSDRNITWTCLGKGCKVRIITTPSLVCVQQQSCNHNHNHDPPAASAADESTSTPRPHDPPAAAAADESFSMPKPHVYINQLGNVGIRLDNFSYTKCSNSTMTVLHWKCVSKKSKLHGGL